MPANRFQALSIRNLLVEWLWARFSVLWLEHRFGTVDGKTVTTSDISIESISRRSIQIRYNKFRSQHPVCPACVTPSSVIPSEKVAIVALNLLIMCDPMWIGESGGNVHIGSCSLIANICIGWVPSQAYRFARMQKSFPALIHLTIKYLFKHLHSTQNASSNYSISKENFVLNACYSSQTPTIRVENLTCNS